MKAVIYYFSGTGNSLVVAKDLASEMGNTQVVPVVRASKDGDFTPSDVTGIVYPVYMFGLPLIIADFLKKAPFARDAYIFGVATYGGLPGRPHSLSCRILKERGIDMAAGFSVLMPGNYTPLYGAIAQSKQEAMFRKEKDRVKQIACSVAERQRGIFEEGPFLIGRILYQSLYKAGMSRVPMSAKNFWLTDRCDSCGICEKVCPVSNIVLQNGKPVWLDHCQHCMACLQWCPVDAIQYMRSTLGKKRYHHPGTDAQAIMEQGRRE